MLVWDEGDHASFEFVCAMHAKIFDDTAVGVVDLIPSHVKEAIRAGKVERAISSCCL